jgi:hypothetical protein
MLSLLLAADDGVINGNLNFADIMFLAAVIIFIIGAVLAAMIKPVALWTVLLFAGLACVSLGWLVL